MQKKKEYKRARIYIYTYITYRFGEDSDYGHTYTYVVIGAADLYGHPFFTIGPRARFRASIGSLQTIGCTFSVTARARLKVRTRGRSG